MRTFGGWAGAVLLGAALDAGCGGPGQPTGENGGRDAPAGRDGAEDGAQVPACAWAPTAPELTLPQGEVIGALRGSSRNLSTTCTPQKGTGGPEAIYLLRLTERTLLDVEVVSEMDTVLAIRRVCDDPLTELGCSDDTGATSGAPLPGPDGGVSSGPVDAGSPPQPDGHNPHLRAIVEAGNYFLLVDEAAPSGVGGEFQLKVHTSPPPAHTSCAGAALVSDGSRLVDEELYLARAPSPCAGAEPRPALFYRAVIPAGQRLTARAVPTAGDRAWTPVLQAFTGCSPGGASDAGAHFCLASERADAQGQSVLRHDNGGPTEQTVLLAVSSLELVRNARFRLDVAIAEPPQNLTCATALPLSDGLVLRAEDLSQGQTKGDACKPAGSPSRFYRATLYPDQYLMYEVDGAPDAAAPFVLILREGCSDVSCTVVRIDYAGSGSFPPNSDSVPKTVIVEAAFFSEAPPTFAIRLSVVGRGGISVAAARGLTTSEAGGQATFEVSVTSAVVDPVDIPIVSNDPAEGIASPATLRFTSDNWQKPQAVTVTGVDDGAKDGNRPYTVTVGPSTSQDRRYLDLESHQVALVNRDDEPGFTFEGPAVLQTSESGARSTFRVLLNRAPSATVRLPLTSSDQDEGKVDPAELVFEPGNWNQAQTVTLTGIDDNERDGTRSYQVVTGPATSADPEYAALDPTDLNARNSDNDFERVAAQVVSTGLSCDGYSWQSLAADQAGNLYAVMECQASGSRPDGGSGPSGDAGRELKAFVAVSRDGGRTFGPPVDTGLPAWEVAVAGGGPGVALVAVAGPTGTAVVRTEDAGVTWQPPTVLHTAQGYNIRLAVAGQRMLLGAYAGTGTDETWLSEDAGRTFQSSRRSLNGWSLAMGLDPDGTIWTVDYDWTFPVFRTSRDAGKTFQIGFRIPAQIWSTRFVASPNLVFTVDYQLVSFSREGSGTTQRVPGVTDPFDGTFRPVLLADERDNLVVLTPVGKGSDTTVEARRLLNGETQLSPPKALGPSDHSPSAVALSENATAVLLIHSGQVSVAVETWP
jgi:hypothetical protein